NTVRHLGMGKSPLDAARDSANEIAVPVLMATITTVAVFLPLVFMTGVGRYLFTPLAVSASLAMAASYLVSRTVSPLYCARFLRPHSSAWQRHFARAFQGFAGVYEWFLRGALRGRWAVLAVVVALCVPAVLCFVRTGQELFPEVDASEFTIHLRAS